MKIDVIQKESVNLNEFEIKYNDIIKYKAILPFVSINEPFNIEKVRKIKIYNLNDEEVYTTDYNYIDNLKESFIPLKYLIKGSQKFNQLIYKSSDNIIKIYYEERDIWDNRYIIEIGNNKYYCYSIEDGYIRHITIHDNELQVGEILKSNVIIDGKDTYRCYLKDTYENISDGVVALILYLDRNEYSTSYLENKSYSFSKSYSYNKNNKYYDNNWVKNNFDNKFYLKVDEDLNLIKYKMKHPLETTKEQYRALTPKKRRIIKAIIIIPIVIAIIIVLLVLFFVLSNKN